MKRPRPVRALKDPNVKRGLALFCVVAGGTALRWLWEDTLKRLDHLEERGLAPVDDFATLEDIERVKGELLTAGDERYARRPLVDLEKLAAYDAEHADHPAAGEEPG